VSDLSKMNLVEIRDSVPDDLSFIFATWLKGLRYGNDWFGLIEPTAYHAHYHAVIEAILTNPAVTVKVACLKEDSDVVLGYAIYNKKTLHWVHVKKAWRSAGLAKSLVPADVDTVTHINKVGVSMLALRPHVRFNPFLIP
jgi:hypothetical protein